MKENKVKIVVVEPEKDISDAIILINKFLDINKINFKYSININHTLDCHGIFFPDKENEINVNPSYLVKNPPKELHDKRYTQDYSIGTVALHEFFHALAEKFNLNEEFKKRFKEKIIINSNCLRFRFEELAELGTLFFLNPYLLRHISPEAFNFLKEKYLSPTPITKVSFIGAWRKWNKETRQQCKIKWKIWVYGNKIFTKN